MKTLIVDDEFTSRLILQEILSGYGPAHIALNGREAVKAFRGAIENEQPYNLICMDIQMPDMNGQQAIRIIRALEDEKIDHSIKDGNNFTRAKIIMNSALDDIRSKVDAFSGLCDDYLLKPVDKERLLVVIRDMHLIP
jgi:two-component system, chemotaxis family, chemotaxis protein CheY